MHVNAYLFTNGRGVRTPTAAVLFLPPFCTPTWDPRYLELHQHQEEREEEAADAQPMPGGGGDTEARS